MVARSSPDISADFPNLQELLHAVRQGSGGACPPPPEWSESAIFPTLSHMATGLWGGVGDVEMEEEMEVPELVEISPFQALAAAPLEEVERALAEPWDATGWQERGVGMIWGGVILILLGMVLACAVPAAWVRAVREQEPWPWRLAWVRTWLLGLPSLALVLAGVGSLRRRRWTVPLVHAGGWFVAMAMLMGIGVLVAGVFFLVPAEGRFDHGVLVNVGQLLLGIGLGGVALPLVLIAIYQRGYLLELCRLSDPRPRWTDAVPEPLLMLWLACGLGFISLGSLLWCGGVVPAGSQMLGGSAGWCALGIGLVGYLLAMRGISARKKWAWWLAAALFIVTSGAAMGAFWNLPWGEITTAWGASTHTADASSGRLAALLVAGLFAGQLMALLMSRGCFLPTEE